MAFVEACWFTAGSSGTANFADGTALSGFRNLADAAAADGQVYSYRAESLDRTRWEQGYGAYASAAGGTLARTVTASSAGGTTKVNFTAALIITLQPLKADLDTLAAFGTGKQSFYIPASSMSPRSTSGAEEGDFDSGSNDITPRTLDFDTTTQEYAHFEFGMPKGWDEGTVTFTPTR